MKCISPLVVKDKRSKKYVYVNCGKCKPCRVNKIRDYTLRSNIEKLRSKSAFFVTLTYSDKYYDDYNLNREHLKLFFKRFRYFLNKNNLKVKYIAVGDYGKLLFRRHFHLIIFVYNNNISLNDAYFLIKKCWHRGFVHCGNLRAGGVRYVLRYVFLKDNSLLTQYGFKF